MPLLPTALQVLVVHGERGTNADLVSEQAAAAGLTSPRFAAHAPSLPIAYGTHHSKAFLLGYRHGGLRLIVHTANMIYPDCNNKTQGLWHQVRACGFVCSVHGSGRWPSRD
jgi:tyrosyl-DNA phosphodiesterase-1